MLCSNYEKLAALDRVKMVGEIVHALQSDNSIFKNVQDLIHLAKQKGLFENVTINPIGENARRDEPPIQEFT